MAHFQWFTRLHRAVYRASGGRLGGRLLGLPMLLLTTRGRRTGRDRTLPLVYFTDGERLVLVASNAGQEHAPAWWLNLQAEPEAWVQIGREQRRMRAWQADPEERARLWQRITREFVMYARYDRNTKREIPIVLLEPIP